MALSSVCFLSEVVALDVRLALAPYMAFAVADRLVVRVQPSARQLSRDGRHAQASDTAGDVGWLSDRAGYRYDGIDPETGRPWPLMPECFRELASRAADRAGYPGFVPDARADALLTPPSTLGPLRAGNWPGSTVA